MAPTAFYNEHLPVLSNKEIMERGFTISQLAVPPSISDSKMLWWERLGERLKKKSEQRNKPHFQHGEDDWLLLWDRVPIDPWPYESRISEVREFLDSYWSSNWFAKIFIQHELFQWLLICSVDRVECIPHSGLE